MYRPEDKKKVVLAVAAAAVLVLAALGLLLAGAPLALPALLCLGVLLPGGYLVRLENQRLKTLGDHSALGARRFLPMSGREGVALAIAVLGLASPLIVDWVRAGLAEALHPVRVVVWLIGGYALWFVLIRRIRLRRA
ncbi:MULTISPECIES: hypothetical protein [Actinosynnema]|uniref:hypothetical protein n=1 Tax=Actinosynnema TaxID=40566 RepID=UPI0020A4B42F|nr:hypothetical protein [Actinosynnema pretiosum]